ncbi:MULTISPECIES: hypothetical protein [unclassified Endozoicomonas]|uniref:hypothetical protein n=1 Tax=unclassified Endozoicomonas TaxID=2644528 RepID=UPI003BB61A59
MANLIVRNIYEKKQSAYPSCYSPALCPGGYPESQGRPGIEHPMPLLPNVALRATTAEGDTNSEVCHITWCRWAERLQHIVITKATAKELSFNKFPISVHPELVEGRATELRQAQSERSQAMKIGKLFPDNSLLKCRSY